MKLGSRILFSLGGGGMNACLYCSLFSCILTALVMSSYHTTLQCLNTLNGTQPLKLLNKMTGADKLKNKKLTQ
jgi:hypothetical protein